MRPIDADELVWKYCGTCDFDEMFCLNCKYHEFRVGIKNAPTIEPQVQHAYWEPSEIGEYHCTHCGVECDVDKFHKALLNPYCGNCGAKMDGGSENG